MSRESRIAATLRLLAAAAALLALAASSAPAKQSGHPTNGPHSGRQRRLSRRIAGFLQAGEDIKRGKQAVHSTGITRVASNLDESCGEEDFAKARISIDWMDTCLKKFTKDDKQGLCSRTKSYFCAHRPAVGRLPSQ